MNSLPLAVRTKTDGDLVWLSEGAIGVATKVAQPGPLKHSKHPIYGMFVHDVVHSHAQLQPADKKIVWMDGRENFGSELLVTAFDSHGAVELFRDIPGLTWPAGHDVPHALILSSGSANEASGLLAVLERYQSRANDFVPVRTGTGRSTREFLTVVQAPQAGASGQSFVVSEQLVQRVLSCQADGERREATTGDRYQLQKEITERVVDAIADIGYRWVERRHGANKLVSFDSRWRVEWCDEELAKLLVYELNVSIVSASRVFDELFGEVYRWALASRMAGDWGHLVADGAFLTLVPAQE